MKFALITDAWFPQINGVVRTWSTVTQLMRDWGHEVLVIHPGLFRTFAAPRYGEIRLSVMPAGQLRRMLDDYQPTAVHVATEGPLGMAGRKFCLKRKIPFSTSYHTQFPYYLKTYFAIPPGMTWKFIRWFHRPARHTLVPTPSIKRELEEKGMDHIVTWTRGVNTELFKIADPKPLFAELPKPIFAYCGRVAAEKNIRAFLELDLPGTKLVIGDGPSRPKLQQQFPDVHWAGYQTGQDLSDHFASADVFVFPSRTDTFGVVMIEAMASGLPVAAYPVTGPIDVVEQGVSGFLDEDLKSAAMRCLDLEPQKVRDYACQFTWPRTAELLIDHLTEFEYPLPKALRSN